MSNFFRDWSAGQATPWLRNDRKTRLFTLQLLHVDDPLNADAIWNQSTGGDETMIDSKAESTSRRLSQALNAHRYTTTAYRGKAPVRRTYVFSDVVVWIAAHVWRDADIDGGNELFYMTERLRYQHQQAFSHDENYLSRPPHYAIMPLDGLADNEVICQFGMGVFLPNSNDEQTASISMTQQGQASRAFKEWVFFEPLRDNEGNRVNPPQGIKVSRPVGLYATQKMLLIAKQYDKSALHSPLWMNASEEGEIIVNMHAKRPSTYGDDVHVRSETPQRHNRQTVCRFHAVADKTDSISLVIDRDLNANNKSDSIINTDAASNSAVVDMLMQHPVIDSGTVIDEDDTGNDEDAFEGLSQIDIDEDEQPDYLYQLQLTGIVLPKLNSLKGRGASYLSHWLLYLDQEGALAHDENSIAWVIKGDKITNTLMWKAQAPNKASNQAANQATNNDTWQLLDGTQPLPFFGEKTVTLDKAELEDKQFGILPLAANGFSIPLPLNEVTLGRDLGDKNTADVPLGLLSNSSALVYRNGKQQGNLANIGLSGLHLRLRLTERTLHLQQISRSKTYVLKEQGGIQTTLSLKQPATELNANESILLGSFRFQFIESFMPDHRD